VRHLLAEVESEDPRSTMLGLMAGELTFTDLREYPSLIEDHAQRPVSQPWLALRELAEVMSGRA
jgi:hypothetical protein